jgi:hypothetical protein
MVKNRVVFRNGVFTDYKGNQRQYIVAAVSERTQNANGNYSVVIEESDKPDEIIYSDAVKKLTLGFAICSPEDKWNEELGKTIALGKAVKRPSRVMWVSHAGMINNDVVNALIEQEMKFFENNPGSIIAGYDEAQRKYKQSLSKSTAK